MINPCYPDIATPVWLSSNTLIARVLKSMLSSCWRPLANECQELISRCQKIQDALPTSPHHPSRSITISSDICIEFPTNHEALSRLDELLLGGSDQVAAIKRHYREACQRVQEETTQQYHIACDGVKSVEHLGGPTDRELQNQIARGLSRMYEAWELQLANFILARFASHPSASKISNPNAHTETVGRPSISSCNSDTEIY